MTTGRLIAVVGPSGVGKDSVIDGMLAADPDLQRVRRVITRPAALGGEDYDSMEPETFGEAVSAGAFCLHWQAHGLSYGIPLHVLRDVAGGSQSVVNLSRGVLSDAIRVFPEVVVLNISARAETLAERLAKRGRESLEDIRQRLARAQMPLPGDIEIVNISNDGTLEDAISEALRALQPASV